MKLLVTAFGPFGGRRQNASSLALAGLKQRLPWLNTRVFPVDSVLAPLRMTQALRGLKPNAVIMLGEAGGSSSIRLERSAWNELDFRIPDIAGNQPQRQRIVGNAPDAIHSTLPLESMRARLTAVGHSASISDDPGRYLCNQLFFHTLWRIQTKGLAVRAGFIHLPLESEYATSKALDALEMIVRVVTTRSIAERP